MSLLMEIEDTMGSLFGKENDMKCLLQLTVEKRTVDYEHI